MWDTDIPIFFVSKTSWRCLQDMSSGRLQDMPSRHLQDMSSRSLQDVFSVTIFRLARRLARCLQDVLEDEKLLRWGSVEDVFKTCLKDVFKTSLRPTNICWEVVTKMLKLWLLTKFSYGNIFWLKVTNFNSGWKFSTIKSDWILVNWRKL